MNYTKYDGPTAIENRRMATEALMDVVAVLGQIIREAKVIPSGTIYAQVMGVMDLRTYNSVIALLKRTGLVQEKCHLLTWVGPEISAEPKEYRAPIKPTQRWFKAKPEDEDE